MTDEARKAFAARWLETYGSPWNCEAVSSIASPTAHLNYQIYWEGERRWGTFADILIGIETTVTHAIGRLMLKQPSHLRSQVRETTESVRIQLDRFLDGQVTMDGHEPKTTIRELLHERSSAVSSADLATRLPESTPLVTLSLIEDLHDLARSVEASESVGEASDGLHALWNLARDHRALASTIANRSVPSVGEVARGTVIAGLRRWMLAKTGKDGVNWDDLYHCLGLYGHDIAHLGSRGKALATLWRRYEAGLHDQQPL